MRLDFYDGSEGNRFSWAALKLKVSAAVIFLAMPTPLTAQFCERQISDCQEVTQSIAPVGGNAAKIPDRGLDSNGRVPLTERADGIEATGGAPADVLGLSQFTNDVAICPPTTRFTDGLFGTTHFPPSVATPHQAVADGCKPSEDSKAQSVIVTRQAQSGDLNGSVYYKNRLEFSVDGGWLPINIPFVFDILLGDAYNKTPLNYTLVPIIFSIRWQMDDVGGPWIFRGNWDLTTSGTVTLIPRGPETRYFAWIMGIRRNFVPRRGRIAPYFDGRVGLGDINAKAPLGVLFAQGQDFTFTVNLGSGVRYNFSPRYSISAGLNWMHISNLYLSQPQFANYGINVYGPMFGIDVRLGKPRRHASE